MHQPTTHYIPTDLLGVDTNAKTIKGQAKRFLTGILYLSPADASGVNLCPMAGIAKCKDPCLYTAGRGAMSPVQQARLNKTRYYLHQRERFMQHLAIDIHRLINRSAKLDMLPLVRLNGTSDIRWEHENLRITKELAKRLGRGPGMYANLMSLFPEVQFYDYTKLTNRRHLPANYDLTFSYSGVPAFQPFVRKAIARGMRIAVVFRNRSIVEHHLSTNTPFLGLPVVDGDDSDVRHLDPQACIVALYAKGRAKTDTSGFVVG